MITVIGSDYFNRALRDPRELVRNAKETLKGVDFNTVACRGVSGMAFAPVLAYAMKKRLIIVRKTIMGSHAYSMIEGAFLPGDRYICVDDFRSSGQTVGLTIANIRRHASHYSPEYAGTYLYNDDKFTTNYDEEWEIPEEHECECMA